MQWQYTSLQKDEIKKKLTKWLVHFMCCAGNVKNTSGSGVWRNDRGQCKYFHRTTSNDIWWYLTDVRHGSEMRYNRRQKTILYELSSGYMYIRKKKNPPVIDELKHCPKIQHMTRRFIWEFFFHGNIINVETLNCVRIFNNLHW